MTKKISRYPAGVSWLKTNSLRAKRRARAALKLKNDLADGTFSFSRYDQLRDHARQRLMRFHLFRHPTITAHFKRALAKIYRRAATPLTQWCVSKGCTQATAKDLVRKTFQRIWQHRTRLRDPKIIPKLLRYLLYRAVTRNLKVTALTKSSL